MTKPTQIIIYENYDYMRVVTDPDDPTGIGTTIASHCPLPAWLVPNMECGLTTAQIAVKDVPDGCKYEIIDADKFGEYQTIGIGSTAILFTDAVTAYDFDTKVSTFDLALAKKVAHRKRRNRRYSEFAPHDHTIKTAIPGTTDAAETSRVGIRSTYSTMQTEIDACSTVDEIYAILQKYPSRPIPPEADLSQYDNSFSLQA